MYLSFTSSHDCELEPEQPWMRTLPDEASDPADSVWDSATYSFADTKVRRGTAASIVYVARIDRSIRKNNRYVPKLSCWSAIGLADAVIAKAVLGSPNVGGAGETDTEHAVPHVPVAAKIGLETASTGRAMTPSIMSAQTTSLSH